MSWFRKKKKEKLVLDRNLVHEKVRGFVGSKTKLLSIDEITDDLPIFSSGVLDSLQFVNLVLFVREELGVNLNDHVEVSVATLDTISQVVDAVMVASEDGEK